MRDQAKAARNKARHEIKMVLQDQLEKNRTRTMTFTEDGLMLAIGIIDGLDSND